MLARTHKIKGRLAIQRVFLKGRKVQSIGGRGSGSSFFTVRFLPRRLGTNQIDNTAHYAVIVPNVLKLNPVKRNGVRRRVYEIIRRNLAFTKGKNYDIVVVVHRPLRETTSSILERELTNLLLKIP